MKFFTFATSALLLASAASAQVLDASGAPANPTSLLDFDNPFVASGAIVSNSPVFTAVGISSVTLVGTWNAGGDTLTATSNVMGQGLVSQNGTLTVGTTGDPLDNADGGAGFDIELVSAVSEFSVLFIDQVNMDYQIELFAGSSPLGVGNFNYSGGFPNPPRTWSLMSGQSFDRILITFPNGSGGVGLDEFAFDGTPGSLGSPYCGPNSPNSTGNPADLSASGSLLVADNDFTLTATDLPNNQFGFFINSQLQGFIPMPGGSQGNLCVAGSIGRFNGAGQIQNSGTSGSFSLLTDLNAMPQPMGPVQVFMGETWNFQCWYRDLNPGAASNFTNGLEVSFQ